MKYSIRLLAVSLALAGCVSSASPDKMANNGWTPDNGDGTFTNPLLWGDWPDPDVTRVGDDFYFVSTSMHYVPGCPIAQSKDLVNWQMAGYAVPRYDEDPRYDLKEGNLYLNGSWASTIRYHNGLFYVGFCTPHGQGTDKGYFSICTATNVSGPWTRTIFPEYLYDPGLLFDDDGKVYVVHGQDTLYVTELNADARSVKTPAKEIFHLKDYPYLSRGRTLTRSTGNITSWRPPAARKAGKSACAPTTFTALTNLRLSSTTTAIIPATSCIKAAWCS